MKLNIRKIKLITKEKHNTPTDLSLIKPLCNILTSRKVKRIDAKENTKKSIRYSIQNLFKQQDKRFKHVRVITK